MVDGEDIGLILQYKVCRVAHTDVAFIVQQFPQDLGLVVEQVFGR